MQRRTAMCTPTSLSSIASVYVKCSCKTIIHLPPKRRYIGSNQLPLSPFLLLTGLPVHTYTLPSVCARAMGGLRTPLGRSNTPPPPEALNPPGVCWWTPLGVPLPVACACSSSADGAAGSASGSVKKSVRNCSTRSRRRSGCACSGVVEI